MRARCPDCRNSVPVDLLPAGEFSVSCSCCGWDRIFPMPEQPSDAILRQLGKQGVDDESTMSVVLGLMSLEQALDAMADKGAVSAVRSATGNRTNTARHEREDTMRRARAVARRHGLPAGLALRVAKGNLKLDAARSQAGLGGDAVVPWLDARKRKILGIVSAVLAAILLVLLAF